MVTFGKDPLPDSELGASLRVFMWQKGARELCGAFFVVVLSLNHVRVFGTPWTMACQAPLSM